MFPLPNQMTIWPNFKSPLLWDVFAVGTYFTVSLLFWYTGLIPDLATLRDRSMTKWRQRIYGFFALGWRGSNRHWQQLRARVPHPRRHLDAARPRVHSVVSMDFATSVIPGWHTTIFPPYFVAGAIFSGFAMVETVLLIARSVFKLKRVVLMRHLELMNKFMLLTSLARRVRVRHGVLHRLVLRQRVRDGALPPQPADRPVLVGVALDGGPATASSRSSSGSSACARASR